VGVDLAAYFRRIGYAGDTAPTLDLLRAVQLAHAQTIPFENLNPLLRWPVRLDPESLERKLVQDGRGGYCFELNTLLRHVLEELAFRVTERRVLRTAAELRETLEGPFGLTLPDAPELGATLARLAAATPIEHRTD